MLRPLFALAATLSLVANTARTADELPGPAIEWPEVKGLEKQKANVFKDAALGYSISYTAEGTVITVFVYNLGQEKVPTGPNSDAIKAEMYESLLALEANKKSGRYKSITPLDEGVIPFGKSKGVPQIRRKRYEVDIAKEGLAITELYVTGYKNHYLKVRATYPSDDKEKGEKLVANLLEAISKELK